MKKKILSMIIAIVMIATYIPNVSANGNNGNKNTGLHIHLKGEVKLDLTQDNVAGDLFFNESKFDDKFESSDYPGIVTIGINENPFIGISLSEGEALQTITHSIPLIANNNQLLKWTDNKGYVSDAISGLRLNIIDAKGLKKTAYFTREDLRIGVEGNGTINNWLYEVQETEGVTTTTAVPTTTTVAPETSPTIMTIITEPEQIPQTSIENTEETTPTEPTGVVITQPQTPNTSMPKINVQQEEVPLADIVTITIQQEQIPQTGENGFAWISFMLLLAAGGVYVGVRRYEKSKIKE